jgi:hypothetical protein
MEKRRILCCPRIGDNTVSGLEFMIRLGRVDRISSLELLTADSAGITCNRSYKNWTSSVVTPVTKESH